jgi:hypothetical protein
MRLVTPLAVRLYFAGRSNRRANPYGVSAELLFFYLILFRFITLAPAG